MRNLYIDFCDFIAHDIGVGYTPYINILIMCCREEKVYYLLSVACQILKSVDEIDAKLFRIDVSITAGADEIYYIYITH